MDKIYFKMFYVIDISSQSNTNVVKLVKKNSYIIMHNTKKQA